MLKVKIYVTNWLIINGSVFSIPTVADYCFLLYHYNISNSNIT